MSKFLIKFFAWKKNQNYQIFIDFLLKSHQFQIAKLQINRLITIGRVDKFPREKQTDPLVIIDREPSI